MQQVGEVELVQRFLIAGQRSLVFNSIQVSLNVHSSDLAIALYRSRHGLVEEPRYRKNHCVWMAQLTCNAPGTFSRACLSNPSREVVINEQRKSYCDQFTCVLQSRTPQHQCNATHRCAFSDADNFHGGCAFEAVEVPDQSAIPTGSNRPCGSESENAGRNHQE